MMSRIHSKHVYTDAIDRVAHRRALQWSLYSRTMALNLVFYKQDWQVTLPDGGPVNFVLS